MNRAHYPELVQQLKDLVNIYRSLFTVVRSERQAIMGANITVLAGLNAAKAKLIQNIKVAENSWSAIAAEMQNSIKSSTANNSQGNNGQEKNSQTDNEITKSQSSLFTIDGASPRLVVLALQLEGSERAYLLRLRKVLNMLVERTHDMNKQNALLIESALAHVNGAMDALRQDIIKDSPYQNKGRKKDSSEKLSGRLMSKEV